MTFYLVANALWAIWELSKMDGILVDFGGKCPQLGLVYFGLKHEGETNFTVGPHPIYFFK